MLPIMTKYAGATMRSLIAFVAWALLTGPVYTAETVRIAVEDDWAPYASMRADGSGPEGFAVDLVREVFASQSLQVEFLVVPFSRCLHYAETGITSGCFNATIIDGNRDTYHWHTTPMFEEELAIFGHASDPVERMSAADLEGKTLGYTLGYTYPTALMENPRITRFGVQSDDQLLQMLAAQRVQYILINEMPGLLRMSQLPEVNGRVKKVGTVSSDGFWVAFSKADGNGERLAQVFEQGLQTLFQNGRYEELKQQFRAGLAQ